MPKVSCILTSFNRPRMLRQALKSIKDQTHQDYELILMDDSSIFDAKPVVQEFGFKSVKFFHTDVSAARRGTENRCGININRALEIARGDIITYLCDDDYFYPSWFQAVVNHMANPGIQVSYGRLYFSSSPEMVFPSSGPSIWPGHPIIDPYAVLDHSQVAHRRFTPPFKWPETIDVLGIPDGTYFRTIAQAGHPFYQIDTPAVVKRRHPKSIHAAPSEIIEGRAENARE